MAKVLKKIIISADKGVEELTALYMLEAMYHGAINLEAAWQSSKY